MDEMLNALEEANTTQPAGELETTSDFLDDIMDDPMEEVVKTPLEETTELVANLENDVFKLEQEIMELDGEVTDDPKHPKKIEKAKKDLEALQKKLEKAKEKKAKLEDEEKLAKEKQEKDAKVEMKLNAMKEEAIKQFDSERDYPNLVGTDIKFVLDTFFDRFYKNGKELADKTTDKVIPVTDVYKYFERFLGGVGNLDAKADELDQLVQKLEVDTTDWQTYKELSFKYFYWCRAVDKEVNRYYSLKKTYEDGRVKMFNSLRPDFASDTATNAKLDEVLVDSKGKLEDMQNRKNLWIKTMERMDKIMDFVKSSNIRDLAEAKRMDNLLAGERADAVNYGNENL